MQTFLSCDWGTTNFRIRLIDLATGAIISEVTTRVGIQSTYNDWQLAFKSPGERLTFYQLKIIYAIEILHVRLGHSLENIPIIISGMASSSIGMLELPYKQIPVNLSVLNLEHAVIEATEKFNHTTLLISGIKSNDDVMRGEETKIAGCFNFNEDGKHLVIIPGTHSKHVVVEQNSVVSFSTYMTGELFHLLTTESILKDSVEEAGCFDHQHNPAFANGVATGRDTNILNSLFNTRTNQLFNKFNKCDNYFYLSGLLIGHELKEALNEEYTSIKLICNKTFEPYYLAAFEVLHPSLTIQIIDSDVALIQGHVKLAKALQVI